MSSFTDPLILEFLGNFTFKVTSTFRYRIGDDNSNYYVVVPIGSTTDFASIPRILWNILPPHGQYGKAAVIHDALYRNHGFGFYNRKQCDQIFYDAMKTLNVSYPIRSLIYAGVRVGGWMTWRKTRYEGQAYMIKM